MHPMFMELFLNAEADDPDKQDRRRRANRARRNQSRMVTRVTVRDRRRLPRR
jgi:hypothetical protein